MACATKLVLGREERPYCANRVSMVQVESAELVAKPPALFRCRHKEMVDARGVLASAHLGDAMSTVQHVRRTPQYQALERPEFLQVASS